MQVQGSNMSPEEFILKVLERDVRDIFRAQHLIVSQRIYLSGKDLKAKQRKSGISNRSGNLEKSLSNPDYLIQSEGENFHVSSGYPLYIRFLDMKEKANLNIYNRQVYGILYTNALREIKSGCSNFINSTVSQALTEAVSKYSRK